MSTEIWKDIEGYEGLYQVSNMGRIKSFAREEGGTLVSLTNNKDRYVRISLAKNGKRVSYSVHRLVAIAFIENPDMKPFINHKDFNRSNNVVANLEWCTAGENSRHAVKGNRVYFPKGEERHNVKLTEKEVRYIRQFYKKDVYGHGIQAIARTYGVAPITIRYLITGKTWKHI